jgi:hypothetical protein
VADPDASATAPQLPIVAAPLLKLIVPVGVAVDGEVAVTVAVKVAAPYVPGLGLEVRTVLVPEAVTV